MIKIKILLVEDEGVTAMNIKADLIELGYEVVAIVARGEEVLQKCAELQPDLILMDITLAGAMSGIEAANEIRRKYDIPFIYLTAHTDSETLSRAKFTEPFGYLSKPCSANTLLATIDMALYKSSADKARHDAERELQRVRHEQQLILDNLGNTVLFLKNRKILWANPAAYRLFGYSVDDNLDGDTEMFYPDHKSYLEAGKQAYTALCCGEICSFEQQMKRKDGTLFWCRLTGQAVDAENPEEGSIWILEDITKRKLDENLLRKSEEKYRTIANFTHDWEFWTAPDERIIYCSPSCERITGHPATAFETVRSLMRQIIHPDDQDLYDQHRKYCNVNKEGVNDLEFRIIRPDGTIRWISHTCQPVFDRLGKFIGTRGSNRDITERKKLYAESTRTNNLESLGVLAGGIAHDFNNLFQGLLGNISLAKMYINRSSEAYQFLENAENVYASATKLTSQLVAFSSGGLETRATLQPAAVLKEIVRGGLQNSTLNVAFTFPKELYYIKVAPSQFQQLITHLLTNAKEAMPDDGTLNISATNTTLSESEAKEIFLAPGTYLKISIQDNGTGISPSNLPHIFDPYFSTKERGAQKGMGLGLALCNTIIRKHDGAITVESELGKGSIFNLFLPAVNVNTDVLSSPHERENIRRRILIMDDAPTVIQVASKFLESKGFRVSPAEDGAAAVNAYKQAMAANDPYSLVILDLTVPNGMGGLECLAQLTEFDPKAKVVLSSGYANDPAMTNFASHGFVGAFEKPYRLDEMLERIEQLLAR
ncbi:MAG: response regulator [Desulfobulbaceae bacterium]|nr:response regulator [Desulfobulbaceae bacterium]